MKQPRTAIVIVNWNGWTDTVRCINACGHLKDFNGAVLVVDNGSTDHSFDRILACVRGEEQVAVSSDNQDIACLERLAETPLRLVGAGLEKAIQTEVRKNGLVSRGVYLINAPDNRGFGGGNNIGLRVALQDPSCQLFWLLNSDAVPERDALATLEEATCNISVPLVMGSVLLNYDHPETIQALGSKVSFHTLKTAHRYSNVRRNALTNLPTISSVGAPVGAAMMLNRAYIDSHGMFDERMFLYFEELDLVSRLIDRRSSVCTRSFVYHKGGQSTGAGSALRFRSVNADYAFIRSRAILAKKLGGITFTLSIFMAGISIIRRVCVGRNDLARLVCVASREGWGADSSYQRDQT